MLNMEMFYFCDLKFWGHTQVFNQLIYFFNIKLNYKK